LPLDSERDPRFVLRLSLCAKSIGSAEAVGYGLDGVARAPERRSRQVAAAWPTWAAISRQIEFAHSTGRLAGGLDGEAAFFCKREERFRGFFRYQGMSPEIGAQVGLW
jgi:hypothetical protein